MHLNLIWLPEEGEKSELWDLTNRIIMNFEIDFANKKHINMLQVHHTPILTYFNIGVQFHAPQFV